MKTSVGKFEAYLASSGAPASEWGATARLITAAPEMLAALRAALKHIDDDMNGRPVCLWKIREAVISAIDATNG